MKTILETLVVQRRVNFGSGWNPQWERNVVRRWGANQGRVGVIFNNEYALQITNGNFYWVKDKFLLKQEEAEKIGIPSPQLKPEKINKNLVQVLSNVNMEIKHGWLVGILGKIGCGKSSLINSLIGETIVMKTDSKTQIVL